METKMRILKSNTGPSACPVPGKLSEDEIRAICAGNGYAISGMVTGYWDLARMLCRKRGSLCGFTFNDAEIDDIVQNVWLKVITIHLKRFTRLD